MGDRGIIQRMRHWLARQVEPHPRELQLGSGRLTVLKEAPFVWPEWTARAPTWTVGDFSYRNAVEYGYNRNALIYAAIQYKVRALTLAPLTAYRGDPRDPQFAAPSHPLTQITANPNEFQSWPEFMSQLVVYYNLSGNAFVFMDRATPNTLPRAMYALRPDRVNIIKPREDGIIPGYEYIPEGRGRDDATYFRPADIMHVKSVNALDPLEGRGRGLSPIRPMSRSVDVDNALTDFIKTFFESGVMMPGYLKVDQLLNQDDAQRIRAQWTERYGGYKNWGDIAIIDSMAEYQRLGLTFEEMEFEGLDARNEARILMALGVPPILIGSKFGLERSTFSNYEEARRAFWQDVMVPELNWFEREFQRFLFTPDGAFVRFNLSNVPALRENVPGLVNAAYTLWQMGVPANQSVRSVGLNLDAIPGGDTPYPGGMVAEPTTMTAHAPPPETKQADDDYQRKYRIWKQFDDNATAYEDRFRDDARTSFRRDEREILALLGEMKALYMARKQGPIQWMDMAGDVSEYYQDAGEHWRDTFIPAMEGLVIEQGKFWAAELGIGFDIRNIRGEEWFQEYTLRFANEVTDTSRDQIHALLATGQAEGWSIQRMQEALELTFQQWLDGDVSTLDYDFAQQRLPQWRAELIARTETTRAANAGTFNLAREWGVETKTWLATMDTRTRPDHGEVDGQSVALDTAFDVGGSAMMHPGDSSLGASVGQIANCRCTMLLDA